MIKKILIKILLSFFVFSFSIAEVIKDIKISGLEINENKDNNLHPISSLYLFLSYQIR